jgi:hypothetical protein
VGDHRRGEAQSLARARRSGRTRSRRRLSCALERLGNLKGRASLVGVLRDVAEGAYSVLERRYLRDVERAHGLPAGRRQVRASHDGRAVIAT